MKKIALCIVLLLSTFSWAAPSPDEYSINVHVSSSHWVMSPAILVGPEPFLRLNVIIDGKKYDLESVNYPNTLLVLGDYKAKLVKNEHRGGYDSFQVYEFLFSDHKTRQFRVVGETE